MTFIAGLPDQVDAEKIDVDAWKRPGHRSARPTFAGLVQSEIALPHQLVGKSEYQGLTEGVLRACAESGLAADRRGDTP